MKTYQWERENASCLHDDDSFSDTEEENSTNNVILNTNIEGGDFSHAGEGSGKLKSAMKKLGISPDLIKRCAIAAYEAEMNVVIHAEQGTLLSKISRDRVLTRVEDKGEGIEDIDQAMKPGYSTASEEIREMGFGAGLGFTNIKRNADKLHIKTEIDKGTQIEIVICIS